MSNYATLCYVPKIDRLNYAAFLRNIQAFKSTHPIILFSDEPEDGWHKIQDPSPVKKSKNRVGVNNLVFLEALKLAEQYKLTRFIYLELDCRVGRDNWDAEIFAEAEQHKDMFACGTPAVYNRKKFHPAQTAYVNEHIARYTAATGFKVPEFNAKADRPLGCLFVMGALGCYSTAIMSEIFMGYERQAFEKAVKVPAFDLFIALRCYQLFKERAVLKLPFLTSVFSSYSNQILTEKERVELLKSGKVCAVHQVKSDNDCLIQ